MTTDKNIEPNVGNDLFKQKNFLLAGKYKVNTMKTLMCYSNYEKESLEITSSHNKTSSSRRLRTIIHPFGWTEDGGGKENAADRVVYGR